MAEVLDPCPLGALTCGVVQTYRGACHMDRVLKILNFLLGFQQNRADRKQVHRAQAEVGHLQVCEEGQEKAHGRKILQIPEFQVRALLGFRVQRVL